MVPPWLIPAGWAFLAVQVTFVALALTLRYRRKRVSPPKTWPPISILVPCEGTEPGLEENLEAAIRAPYPAPRQVIFCAADARDPAVAVIDRVLARLERSPPPPDSPPVEALKVLSHRGPAALNRKLRHLAAALPLVRHEVIVAADSDTRPGAETLPALVSSLLADPDTGLAFAPPRFGDRESLADRTLSFGFAASLHAFYTLQALTTFVGGDAPVVGSLIAIRRRVLEAAGGYRALAGHIGDDLELGRRVRELDLRVVAAPVTVDTPHPGLTFRALFRRMHRWIVVGAAYAPWRLPSYPLVLAPLPWVTLLTLLAVIIDPATPAAIWAAPGALFSSRLIFAAVVGSRCYRRLPRPLDLILLPLWESVLSLCAIGAAFSRTVDWRGRRLKVLPGGAILCLSDPSRPHCPEIPANKGGTAAMLLPHYARHLFRRHFHGVWVRGLGELERCRDGRPVIFAANHSSWWDGPMAYLLHVQRLPWDFYVFMRDRQLRRYRFFTRAGAFSINRENPRSAANTLRYAEELLCVPGRAVWIFPQGTWIPADRRPLRFENGVGHLARGLEDGWVVPVTIHYSLRAGPCPEAFVSFGRPHPVRDEALEVKAFVARLEDAVTRELDGLKRELAQTPLEEVPAGFERLLEGRRGVSAQWDRVRAVVGLHR